MSFSHYRMQAILGILFTFLTISSQVDIRGEDSQSGFRLTQISNINIHTTNQYFAYNFDVHAIQYVLSWYTNLQKICATNFFSLAPLINEIESNMHWTNYNPLVKIPVNNLLQFNITQFDNEKLNEEIGSFNNKFDNEYECFTLKKIMSTFIRLNRKLNGLYYHNSTAVVDLMSVDHLIMGIDTAIRFSRSNNSIFPFDFHENFLPNFFFYSRFSFYQDNYTITLLFDIPSFQSFNFYHFNPKPFIIQSKPFIIKTNETYLASKGNKLIFYNDNSIKSHCSWARGQKFCYEPFGNWNCEKDLMSQIKVSSSCLRAYSRINIMTNIFDNIYFIIFNPLTVKIRCKNTEFFVTLNTHTKILNNEFCSLSSKSFLIDSNSSFYNVLTLENSTVTPLLSQIDFKTIESYINMGFLTITIIVYVVTLGITIYISRRKIRRLRREACVTVRLSDVFESYIRPTRPSP